VVKRKRCPYCFSLFYPDRRVGSRQKACRKKSCQIRRRTESQKRWREDNRDYWCVDRLEDPEAQKAFRQKRVFYMRRYRQTHPDYVCRDNERRNRSRSEGPSPGIRVRRNQDEKFVKHHEIKRLIMDFMPCRNQDEICPQMPQNKQDKPKLPPP